jgi:phosphoribosylanthranilate isomerase
MPVRVKICGVTSRDDALAAVAAGADALGVNFFAGSRRHVTAERAGEILEGLPPGVLTVGVFVNARRDVIETTLERLPLGAIQLHGDERPEDCRGFAVTVIKALRARPGVAAEAERYPADFVLLDADATGDYGGTGESFPWELARGVAAGRLFLAGGLRPDNVGEAVRSVRPWAVDVASGVESAPGKKDPRKLEEFIVNAKSA